MQKKIYLHGANGKMGREISAALKEKSNSVFDMNPTKLEEAHVIIDFSTVEGNSALYAILAENKIQKKSVLIGTTGLSQETIEKWQKLASTQFLNVMIAPNTSLGVLLAVKAAMGIVGIAEVSDFDVEIVETHHRNKVDAPSGTAKFLAENIVKASKNLQVCYSRDGKRQAHELGVHAVRGGGVFGEHEIRFISPSEELTIKHRAFSRALFAKGAIILARWLSNKEPGFYSLFDVDFVDMV